MYNIYDIYICIYINYVHVLYKNLLAPLYITLHKCHFGLRTLNHNVIRIRYNTSFSILEKLRSTKGTRLEDSEPRSHRRFGSRLGRVRFVDFYRNALLFRSLFVCLYACVCVCVCVYVCIFTCARAHLRNDRCLKILEISHIPLNGCLSN